MSLKCMRQTDDLLGIDVFACCGQGDDPDASSEFVCSAICCITWSTDLSTVDFACSSTRKSQNLLHLDNGILGFKRSSIVCN